MCLYYIVLSSMKNFYNVSKKGIIDNINNNE